MVVHKIADILRETLEEHVITIMIGTEQKLDYPNTCIDL